MKNDYTSDRIAALLVERDQLRVENENHKAMIETLRDKIHFLADEVKRLKDLQK